MNESEVTALAARAIEVAREAWKEAHRGLPSNPMTKTADVVAVAAVAASILNLLRAGDERVKEKATEAIVASQRASGQTTDRSPGGPMIRSAEKAAVGIVAAGILNCLHGPR